MAVEPPREGMFRISAPEFGGTARAAGKDAGRQPAVSETRAAVEAIAIEVERIGEAQRFVAKLLAERPVKAQAEQVFQAPRSRRPVIMPVP